MSSSAHTTVHRLNKTKRMNQSPPKSAMLPKAIRDELRMCVALRGYSSIRGGFGKKLDIQYKLMETFYHGTSTQPSQIELLVNGQLAYASLYDSKTAPVVSKNQKKKKRNKKHQHCTTSNLHLHVSMINSSSSISTSTFPIWSANFVTVPAKLSLVVGNSKRWQKGD